MSRRFADPPAWTHDQLEAARESALGRFVDNWGRTGDKTYEEIFRQDAEPVVRRLFDATDDLRRFEGSVFEADQQLVAAARYLGGPPVSADDLDTIVGASVRRRSIAPELAAKVADVLRAAWDPVRFPWLAEGRAPVSEERESAILWTAGIWSVERFRTGLRTGASRRQEDAVAAALRAAGLEEVPRTLRHIRQPDDLDRGTFTREVQVAGSKCDVPTRLRDGRLLAIECKVSNSAINSVKRLIRETGGKARRWRDAFGDLVLTSAVISGVFKLGNLLDAQNNYGIFVVWEHDLTRLQDFVESAV